MENHIGENIKRLSEEKDIKARALAYKWGRSPQQVYNLFKNPNPTADVICDMSRILGVTLNEIFGMEAESANGRQKTNISLKNSNNDFELTLIEQIKIKDQQINFLQRLIEKNA